MLLAGYLLLFGSYPELLLASLTFWSSMLIYNINTGIKFNFLDRHSYRSLSLKNIWKDKMALVAAIVVLIHIPFLKIQVILFLAHLGLISTLYNVPEKSRGIVKLPLRSIPVLKIFLISYVWSAMATWLPAIQEGTELITAMHLRIFAGQALFIFAITIPFDIRDMSQDQKTMLITIPTIIGMRRAKMLSLFCLTLFVVLMHPLISWVYLLILAILTGTLIIFSSPSRKEYYYTFFMDGTIVLYLCSIILTLKK